MHKIMEIEDKRLIMTFVCTVTVCMYVCMYVWIIYLYRAKKSIYVYHTSHSMHGSMYVCMCDLE